MSRLNNVENPAGGLMQYLAWGTGSVAENVADTSVTATAPTATTRVTGTLSLPVATTSRCVGTITAAGTVTISEVGRFNIATVGGTGDTLLQRHVFTGIPLLSGDAISYTIDLLD
jgi:hypothetical protein